jgi:hypothetical protein
MPEPTNQHSTPSATGRTPAATYRIAYAEVLNPSQLKAVTWGQGHLLVIAGAGSGKTRTLTYRVARLIEDGVSPHSILLLSFTRKAAQKMIQRAATLLDRRCGEVTGGTFHSFAHSVLRQHAHRIGLQHNFSILDKTDTEDLIGMMRREWEPQEARRDLPKKATLADIFSRSVNKGVSLEEVVKDGYPDFGHQIERIKEMWGVYQHRKREHNYCDFDDLLVYLRQLLRDHADLRCRLKRQFEHILVDEYQDTNHIQADIIYLLAGQTSHVMVVGDDSQSIYAFRGAEFENIIGFPERFPGTRLVKPEDFLAHIKIVAAPDDRLSWHRALCLIPKVGPKTAQRIFEAVHKDPPGPKGLPEAVLKKTGAAVLAPLHELIANANAPALGMHALGDMVLRYYLPLLRQRYDDHSRRLRDLEQLLSIEDIPEGLLDRHYITAFDL